MSLQNSLFEFAVNARGLIFAVTIANKYRYFIWNFKRNKVVYNFNRSF